MIGKREKLTLTDIARSVFMWTIVLGFAWVLFGI